VHPVKSSLSLRTSSPSNSYMSSQSSPPSQSS